MILIEIVGPAYDGLRTVYFRTAVAEGEQMDATERLYAALPDDAWSVIVRPCGELESIVEFLESKKHAD